MSAWRRIAIEAAPSCKKTIERAKGQFGLWDGLFAELESAYDQVPQDDAKIRQIYAFALACKHGHIHGVLNTTASWFFDRVFDAYAGQGKVGRDAATYLSASEFREYRGYLLAYHLSEEDLGQFDKDFFAAQYKTSLHIKAVRHEKNKKH